MPWKLDQFGMRPDNMQFGYYQGDGVDYHKVYREYDWAHGMHATRGKEPPVAADPIKITQHTGPKKLPDYFYGATSGTIVVSRRFRDLVEKFDPVQHLFIPCEIYEKKSGEAKDGEYFVFKPLGFLKNGIVVEESDVKESINPKTGKIFEYETTGTPPRLMWRQSVIAGRHIWADPMLHRAVVVSDALQEAMVAGGVTGMQWHESHISEKFL